MSLDLVKENRKENEKGKKKREIKEIKLDDGSVGLISSIEVVLVKHVKFN